MADVHKFFQLHVLIAPLTSSLKHLPLLPFDNYEGDDSPVFLSLTGL